MAEQGEKRRRLVLIASPLQGHMTPMLQLGSYLHSKGFSITFAHSELNPPDPSNHPDFIFLPLPDKLSDTGGSSGFIQFLQALNNNCKPHLQKHLIQIIDEQKASTQKESIVIIHDNLMFCAGSIAGDLGLPSIIVRSSSAACVPAYRIIPQLHKEVRFPVEDSLLQEMVPGLDPLRYKDIPFISLTTQQSLKLTTLFTSKTPPVAFIWNTIEFLEQSALTQIRHRYKVPVFTIGPLHKTSPTPSNSFLEEDTSCISWLDKQSPKSVIYASVGSLATMDAKVATEMAWGLANSNQPFIWVVRPGSVHGCDWIEFLPEDLVSEMKVKGLIVKWAPQKDVLAHSAVGGFWSHCGWNSTLESVCEGVPMLCQPFNNDQFLNARYLSHVWKMGLEIVEERGEIESAIKRVFMSKEGEEMRCRAMEIQEQIKVAVSHGGSSQNSMDDLVKFILSL
ncbi:UDP-glycosyltransferase 76H1 [Lactuca sativa]|uniref:UDP-glucose iridoid glucosyltransferase-like n=1 Tax=Lactuca sativa TaxID=4236 RepID=A0A9R1VII2_LACSA|nr:UDP-glycosyltransferase 76H1 [Lactuca sativa]KAJ0207877.1 hypothetical protein LSAT_V11C500290490 [Lactuca sativa]